MPTRFINKVNTLAEILNLPKGAGIGVYGGVPYMNLNGAIMPLGGSVSFGNAILVDGDNGSDTDTRLPYKTIQAAVLAASAGDKIYIRALKPSTTGVSAGTSDDPPGYVGNITILPAQVNLSLIGVGGGLNQMSQPCIRVGTTTTAPLITVQAVGVTIANLTINGSAGTGGGIKLDAVAGVSDAGGLVVTGCHFKGCQGAATVAGRGGGIWYSGGGSWYVTIADCDFFKCRVGIADIGNNSVSVPKDLKILGCRFWSDSNAGVDCDIDLKAGGDGVTGVMIDSCRFGTVDVPAYATGLGYKSRYLDLTGCTNGHMSNCTFACTGKTFTAAGDAALCPATVRKSGNWQENALIVA